MNNRYKVVWKDGTFNTLLNLNGWRLEGQRKLFSNITELETYYKSKIIALNKLPIGG